MGRRSRRRRRIVRIGVALLLLAALAAAVFLFQVRTVTVYGNTRHSSEEIAEGLTYDILTKNTLYLMWRYRDGEIPDTLPFLNSLHVEMKSPYSVDVHVTEKEPAAYIDQGGYVYFDQEGIVLEFSNEASDSLPLVTGVQTGEATLYQKLPTESSAQLRTILSLTELFSYYELQASEIRFGENMEITAFIGGVEVLLGQDEYLEEKVANLNQIIPRLEGQSGSLHLESFTGRNETVSFTPSDGSGTVADVTEGSGGQEEDTGAEDGAAQDQTDSSSADGSGGDAGAQDGSGGDAGAQDGSGADSGADTQEDANAGEDGAQEDGEENAEEGGSSGTVFPMVFDSSGTLVYNVHIENGVVVDSNGNPVSGVTVNENGNVVDAYMNEFDSTTGEWIQQ